MYKYKMLVIGGRGLVGRGIIETLEDDEAWCVIGVARQPPGFSTRARFISLDLTDRDACRSAFTSRELADVTHVVYAALYEQPDLIAGWRDAAQIATNVRMLENVLDFIKPAVHMTLLQGTKAYGAHIRPMLNPGKEWHPRPDGPNFYWPQEDMVREWSARGRSGFTIMRPQIVCGIAAGSPMNMTMALGVFAAISKALGRPLVYPGGAPFVTQATDAYLLGRAICWASQEPACHGETFNVTNGDELVWRSVWPAIADVFGMDVGDETQASLAETMPRHEDVWSELADRHDLRYRSMRELVGSSWQFADAVLGLHGSQNTLLSTIKLRRFGFGECLDTEDMFAGQLRRLQAEGILPR